MKQMFVILSFILTSSCVLSQCNQHVFSSVGANKWTSYQYSDCDGLAHYFGLPSGGYTIILCADIGTAFVLNGDGFVYPLLKEHPSYPSCIQSDCLGDLDGNGEVDVQDLLLFLGNYGLPCD